MCLSFHRQTAGPIQSKFGMDTSWLGMCGTEKKVLGFQYQFSEMMPVLFIPVIVNVTGNTNISKIC